MSSKEEDALLELDIYLLIKEGWPRSSAEQMAIGYARERAIAADQEQARAREQQPGGDRRRRS